VFEPDGVFGTGDITVKKENGKRLSVSKISCTFGVLLKN
jgi:hypothetical protein